MTDEVKGHRAYDSTGRREQARRARGVVLSVARDMFLAHGFSATTVPAVARAAHVSAQSVYKAFGSKAGLAKAVFDVAMAGDDEAVSMVERQALTAVREEADPYVQLRLYGAFVAETAPRHVPIQLVVRAAALTDADASAIWEQLSQERLTGMTMFARQLEPHLRSGVTLDGARDLLWAWNSAEMWDLLVLQRGWSPERYGAHLADTLIRALLP